MLRIDGERKRQGRLRLRVARYVCVLREFKSTNQIALNSAGQIYWRAGASQPSRVNRPILLCLVHCCLSITIITS